MRNRFLILFLVTTLVTGALFLFISASSQAAMGAEAVAVQALPGTTVDRQPPGYLQEVPADMQALFAEGLPASEFMQMAGYVPQALEEFATGEALMIIEFTDPPLAAYYAQQQAQNLEVTTQALESYQRALQDAQTAVTPQIESLGVTIISNYTAAYNGLQVYTPLSKLNELRALPGVKAIHLAPIHEVNLSASVPLIGVPEVWDDLGYDGEGITIAIIDTGIDYTHAVFGGSGDPNDYASNNPDIIEPFTFPTAKVIGGYDFAGTTYDANTQPIPFPDPDPLDENGHGTHVASIAAGTAAGDVSSGVAPEANLIALKVFGQDGSTALVLDALEWATHHYMLFGWPQVVNMSLGSNFGTNDPANPSVVGSDNATAAGIIVVASAGNAGDNSYITGSPAAADGAISVAASEDGYSIQDGFAVLTPTSLAGVHPSLQSANFDWTSPMLPVTGTLVYPEVGDDPAQDQRTGCYPFNATNTQIISGNIVLLDWNTPSCAGSVTRAANAVAAGAIGVFMVDDSDVFDLYIAGSSVVPAYSLPLPIGDALKDALAAGAVEVVMTAEYQGSIPYDEPTAVDIIAAFSSRGPRGYDSALKPEITAPGGSIFAAGMGSGTGGVSLGGTSMAAPHVAGVAALMLQANPDWAPEAIKAAMMNTAVPLLDNTPIPRAGSGRINAYRAVDTGVYAVGNDDLVSLSWGVPTSRNDLVTHVSHVTVYNESASEATFLTEWAFQEGSMTEGVNLAIEPASITVAAGGSAVVTVTLTVDMTAIPVLYGATGVEEFYGWVMLTPEPVYTIYLPLMFKTGETAATVSPSSSTAVLNDNSLVVPFYFQPRPYAELEEIVADNVISDPINDTATFTLTHGGPVSSSLWVYPALAWNDTPDPTLYGPGDIRLFGMDYGWESGTYGDIIAVGINAWDAWHVPQPFFAEFDLYIDADRDGTWDYVNFNWNYGAVTVGRNDNTWVVLQVDLSTGLLYLASPYLIYTDYNASYMEWYLPAAWQDLGPGNSNFDYQLYGFDLGGMSMTPAGSFDYENYPFDWTVSNDPGPANDTAVIEVNIASETGYYYSQPLGVMIVDYNGDPHNVNGGQAYFEPITVTNLNLLDLTILHTNDVHARVDEYNRNGAWCAPPDQAAGLCIAGAPRIVTAVDAIRDNTDNVLLLDAGDQFQGTLFYNLYKGDVLTLTMNYIGYDAMAVGNHEFDNGPEVFASFISGADFPVLSANTDASTDPYLQGLILPYVILQRGGHDIGVIGLTTPDTANISSPGANITFTAPLTTLQTTADLLIGQGVDKIIALTHMGYEEDLDLAAQVTGVDIIIGGHSHSFLYYPADPITFSPPTFPQFGPLVPAGEYPTVVQNPDGDPVLVATAYQWGTFLGNLDVIFGADGLVHYYNGNPIYLGTDVAKDPVLDAMLQPFRDGVADLRNTVVGTTTVDLPINVGGQLICRLGECLLGNLVADSMLWKVNELLPPQDQYQIAFQNGGGLRAPIISGTVTMGQVLETLPFGNAIATFELQGQYVKEALENGARLYPSANGGFAQVSGMRYTIDPAQPVGSRIVNVEVWNGSGWDPLDLNAMYKVVTNDFMRRGGDNYTVFRDYAVNPYDFGPALDEALAEYFQTYSPVTPVIEGRIIIVP